MKNFGRITFLFIFLIQNNLFAQMEKAQTVLSTAPYVFNGVVLGFNFIQDDSGQYFMSYKMKVKQNLKGDSYLKLGDTIEVIMSLPDRYQVFEDGSYVKSEEHKMPSPYFKGWSMGVNTQGIFGIQKSTISATGNKNLKSFEPSVLPKENSYFAIVPYFVKYDAIEHVNICTYSVQGFDVNFNSFENFNAFLGKMNLPAVSDLHPYEKKSAETIKQDSLNAVQYAKRVANAKVYDEFLKTRIQKKDSNPSKALEDVKYQIINETVTGTGTQYFEFDIVVSGSSSNTYLDNSAFVLEFNTAAFGINLVYNNLITLTRGSDYSIPTYEDPMNMATDDSQSSVRFRIGTDNNISSWNRVLVTPTPNQLAHVKMQLIDCNGFTDLTFGDVANVSYVDTYTDNPTISPTAPYFYDYADYIYPVNYELCPPPAISGFSPQTISAGTKSILTITGHGFGNTRGASQVRFMDANTANTTIQFLDAVDYYSWSDTKIQIVLPYFVDSLTQDFYPGSGIFSIKKGNGDTLFSPSPINIQFALKNSYKGTYGVPDYKKIPYRHINFAIPHNGRSREFSLDTSITNNPQMAAVIFKALRTWTCATGINWVIVDTVMTGKTAFDGKSIIYLTDNEFEGNTKLGLTTSDAAHICTDANTTEEYISFEETDIAFPRYFKINTQTPMDWNFDTTMTQNIDAIEDDFYKTVLHELGHAHYLGHVRDENDIMYFLVRSYLGQINASDRVRLYTSPNSMFGGNYVMARDVTIVTTGACFGTGIDKVTAHYISDCGDLGISFYQKTNQNISDINVYPNPFEQSFSIDFNLKGDMDVSYLIYDLSGRIAFQKEKQALSEGEHTEKIDLSTCSQGFYILSVQMGNNTNTYSIIKQ